MIGRESNPDFGICTTPYSGWAFANHLAMALRPREILAANLKTLMGASRRLGTLPEIAAASKGALSNGTLDRIRRAESATSVDYVGALADVFGLEPWQLLVPGLRAELGADGNPVVIGLPDWPFEMVEKDRYFALHEPSRAYVQAKLSSAIEEREGPRPPDGTDELARQALLHGHGKPTVRASRKSR
jgi:hypothetical protein